MKRRDFKTLALLGLSSGLLLSQQSGKAGPAQYMNGQDLLAMVADHACSSKSYCNTMADHKCKGKGGCGSYHACSNGNATYLTADREQSQTTPFLSPDGAKKWNPNDENLGYHMFTEEELMRELNEEGIKMYKSLSPEGKALALRVASARCGNANECAGLNACQTDKNECAGKASCRGQGKCAFSDKNLAVKVVYNKMMKEKRARAMNEPQE